MGIVANKIITGNQLVYEKPEDPKPVKEPPKSGSKISAGRLITGARVVYEAPPKKKNTESFKQLTMTRSLADNQSFNIEETEPELIDKRLSSYFLVQKESDYLDHNIRNNRR